LKNDELEEFLDLLIWSLLHGELVQSSLPRVGVKADPWEKYIVDARRVVATALAKFPMVSHHTGRKHRFL
jgi:hypothetical protein